MAKQKPKELIRVEEVAYTFYFNGKKVSHTQKVLIYEDQPEQLNEGSAAWLFKRFPQCREIHELHDKWGGRWTQSFGYKAQKEIDFNSLEKSTPKTN